MDRKIVELLVEGKSVREIREQLRVGSGRLTKVTALAAAMGYLDKSVPIPAYPALLFPDRVDKRAERGSEADEELLRKQDWILERLQAGWQPITIYEELNIPITRSSFYRFLHRHEKFQLKIKFKRVIPEIVHLPGEALLLDWGKVMDFIEPSTGKKKTLWAFVGILGFSRYVMVRLVLTNALETTLNALESIFRELGGVPQKLTSDNPKCFALKACPYEPILNPGLELFLAHYQVQMECLPPRDPQKKGKVERMMPYVRRLFQAHGEWRGIEEAQVYLDAKLELGNLRIHGTTRKKPFEEFKEVEQAHLKPLPALAYEKLEYGEATVRQDGHVRFQNKYYSLEEKYIDEEVFILGSKTLISIYHRGKLIETHQRLEDAYMSKSTKSHHLKPWEQAMQEHSHYLKRAAKLGPDVERMILIILQQGNGFIDTRKIWGILSFDKKYTAQAINLACQKALARGEHGYRAVQMFLNIQNPPVHSKKASPKTPSKGVGNNKFVRPLSDYAQSIEE